MFRYLEIGREMGWGMRQRQERTTSPTPDYPTTTATVATATATTSNNKTTAMAATNRLGNDEGRHDDRGANGGEPRRPEGLIQVIEYRDIYTKRSRGYGISSW